MKTIHMGLNTEPAWVKADEVIERWKAQGSDKMVEYWNNAREVSLSLRSQILEALEEEDTVQLSWSCTGRTRHMMHASQWRDAMPELDFIIGENYICIVRKK